MLKCPYPWSHIFVSIKDYTTPCCVAHRDDDEEWYGVDYKEGIFNNKHIEMRKQMEQGEWPKICSVCKRDEEIGRKSYRQRAIKKYDVDYNNPKITYLDIKYDNICNLACRMCNPNDSSLIQKELEKHNEHPIYLENKLNNHIDSNINDKMEYSKKLIADGITTFKITGGETLASKHGIEIIKWCIDNDYAKNIHLRLTTNGTKFSKIILERLSKFKKVTITISVDGVGKLYDYIRWPGKWTDLEKSIKNFKENMPSNFATTQVNVVLSAYNLFDIDNIKDWCKENDFDFNIDTNIKPHDIELNASYLPDFVLDAIDIKMPRKYNIDKLRDLKKTTLIYDKQRGQDYHDYLDPLIVECIDSVI